MVLQLRPRTITVDRGSRGFGLSLIYRGLDKYEEKDTGIFVARVVPGGKSIFYSVRFESYECFPSRCDTLFCHLSQRILKERSLCLEDQFLSFPNEKLGADKIS